MRDKRSRLFAKRGETSPHKNAFALSNFRFVGKPEVTVPFSVHVKSPMQSFTPDRYREVGLWEAMCLAPVSPSNRTLLPVARTGVAIRLQSASFTAGGI